MKPTGQKRILVPVMGTALSKKVIRAACILAKKYGFSAKIFLLLDGSKHLEDLRSNPGDTRSIDQIITDNLLEYKKVATDYGIQAEADFRSGKPVTEVLEEVKKGDFDFIIVGRYNPRHLGLSKLEIEKIGFAAKLAEESPIPVMIINQLIDV